MVHSRFYLEFQRGKRERERQRERERLRKKRDQYREKETLLLSSLGTAADCPSLPMPLNSLCDSKSIKAEPLELKIPVLCNPL
jgi:hypothetical protein